MKVFVVLDGLFTRNDGIPSSNNTAYDFYRRYLDAFDNVTVVARCFDVEDPRATSVTGKDVDFWVLPGYQGPQQFLRALPRIVPTLFCLLKEKGAIILRLPATIPCALGLLLFLLRRPYAVELVGARNRASRRERDPLPARRRSGTAPRVARDPVRELGRDGKRGQNLYVCQFHIGPHGGRDHEAV